MVTAKFRLTYVLLGARQHGGPQNHNDRVDKGSGNPTQGNSAAAALGARNALVVEDTADGVLLKTAPVFAPTRPEDVFASLTYAGPPKTLEDMEAGIAAEARRRHAGDRR
jgi:hypothetical protein